MLRGIKKLDFKFIWTMAAYDLIKLPRLIGAALNGWKGTTKAQRRRIRHSNIFTLNRD